MSPDETLWTANDVARYLKASRSWVYQHAESGVLPSVRIMGLLRFHPDAVRAFATGTSSVGKILNLPTTRTP